ncbi:MAG: hypothetical protein H6Q02_1647 [Acidobacteria bacterium]|nr:hypothetical protein [Acidobacteriota bacterium]
MKKIVLVAILLAIAIPGLAQAPAPAPTPVPTTPGEPPTTQPPDMPAWEPEPTTASGQPGMGNRWYFGGGIGLSFGTVDYVEIAPMVGYRVTPDFNLGLSAFYRYRNDDRYEESVSTNDYGGSLFAQYQVVPTLFLHGEAEYVNYEYILANLDTASDTDTNLLAGLGYGWPVGGSSIYFLALYNFSYDENDFANPYDSPWVFRVGVTF